MPHDPGDEQEEITVPETPAAGQDLVSAVLALAVGEVGVRETSRNRGPRVDEYLRTVGLDPTHGDYPWCAAFAFSMYEWAAAELGRPNPCPRSARALGLWFKARPETKIHTFGRECYVTDPERVKPGAIFVVEHLKGKGHCGLVLGIDHATRELDTVEGNSAPDGGREGVAVVRRVRQMPSVNLGYLRLA